MGSGACKSRGNAVSVDLRTDYVPGREFASVITESPETIDIVLINRPEIAPSGAGEPSIRSVAAAVGNAIFDATGVRIRRVPFSPEKVKASFS